ncbi:MAG: FliH/SctL family protein [Bdellovibrionota bacterium]
MAEFKLNQFQIERESEKKAEIKITRLEEPQKPKTSAYTISKIGVNKAASYQESKGKFGIHAMTDERSASAGGGAKNPFEINAVSKKVLGIGAEEVRAIEAIVAKKVADLELVAFTQGHDNGYKDGFKKGEAEAIQKFTEAGKARVDRLDSFLMDCEASKVKIFEANEKFLIGMIFKLAKYLALKEIGRDPEYVLRLAHQVLEKHDLRDHVRIRVNPKDLESAAMIKTELPKRVGEMRNLTLEASEEVREGGCVVETEWLAVDASLETQIQRLHDALVGEGQA